MAAPNANNTGVSRRQIRGNTAAVSHGVALRKYDAFHDRHWSFDPELRTGRKERKPRKPRVVKDWMPITDYINLRSQGLAIVTDADLLAELQRRQGS